MGHVFPDNLAISTFFFLGSCSPSPTWLLINSMLFFPPPLHPPPPGSCGDLQVSLHAVFSLKGNSHQASFQVCLLSSFISETRNLWKGTLVSAVMYATQCAAPQTFQ